MKPNQWSAIPVRRARCAVVGLMLCSSMAAAQSIARTDDGGAKPGRSARALSAVNSVRSLSDRVEITAPPAGVDSSGSPCCAGATPEGEPCMVPLPADTFNAGCDSSPDNPPLSPISVDEFICAQTAFDATNSDTDWYEVNITIPGRYVVEVFSAGEDVIGGILGNASGPLLNPTCSQITMVNPSVSGPGGGTTEPVSLSVGTYWLFASAAANQATPCFEYSLRITPDWFISNPCPAADCPADAVVECEECAPPELPGAISDCCLANGTPGCDDPTCEAAVCAFDAFCCDTEWDDICADIAAGLCDKLCGGVPSCNDGCNISLGFAAQPIACGDTICGTITAAFSNRDTDWYEIEVTNPEGAVITATLEADFPGVVFILEVSNCNAVSILGQGGFSSCQQCQLISQPAVAGVDPGFYYVFVSSGEPDGSGIFEGIVCDLNADYVLTVESGCGGVACPCVADLDGNCIVNADDLGVLLNDFDCSGPGCAGDLNDTGSVDADDLAILLNNFACQR